MSGPVSDDAVLPYGYSVDDVDGMARKAAFAWGRTTPPFDERVDIARFAIVEHLLTSAEIADFHGLVNLGDAAIKKAVEINAYHRGEYTSGRGVAAGTPKVSFWRYWNSASAPALSPEEAIVDALALVQIWPRLTSNDHRVITALAAHDDYEVAANSLGVTTRSLRAYLSGARSRFLRLWHEHEKPSQMWGHDRRKAERSQEYLSITARTIRMRARAREYQRKKIERLKAANDEK